jgi:hypothetical protein
MSINSAYRILQITGIKAKQSQKGFQIYQYHIQLMFKNQQLLKICFAHSHAGTGLLVAIKILFSK